MDRLKKKAFSGLRYLEQYTKTDMVYLAKGSFWGIIAQITLAGIIFLLAIAFAHFVPKEIYGEYKYILSIASILGAITMSGLSTSVLESTSRGFDGTLGYAFWQNIKWSALFFVTSLGISIYYFLHGNSTLGISLLAIGCVWPFFVSTNLYNPYLIAKKDFRRSAVYFDIIGNLFPSICLLVVMMLKTNATLLVLTYIFSNTLIGLILYKRVIKIYPLNEKVDREMLNYSKHLSFIYMIASVASNIDQILLFHYVGAAQLAIYNFATAIPDQIKGPIKNLTNLIFPKFVERDDKDIRSGMKNKFFYLFIASISLIVIYIFTAPYIFNIFFPKYASSIFYSQIFSLSLLWMIAIPADTYLNAKKKIKSLYIYSTSGSIFQIILLFVGVIYWGLLGLVVARVLTRLVSSIVSIVLYQKASKEAVIENEMID